jgi:hypothetical protein
MSDMKFLTICLILSICPVFGQTSVSEVLAQGLKPSIAEKSPISEEDKKALMAATAALLIKHVTFRADGTVSGYYTFGEKKSVEWKNFVVNRVVENSITEADKLNGVTKRCAVAFGCDAHRIWDVKTTRWGEWQPRNFTDFPLGLAFQLKKGVWTADSPALLKYFTPGPGTNIADSTVKPAGKTTDLPPGMQKSK